MRRLLAFFALASGVGAATPGLPPLPAGGDPQPDFYSYTASGSLETPRLSLSGIIPDEDDADLPEPEAGVYHPAAPSCRFGLAATRRVTRKLWVARTEPGAFRPLVAESLIPLPAGLRFAELQVVFEYFGRGPPAL